jgi:hypothetical protein
MSGEMRTLVNIPKFPAPEIVSDWSAPAADTVEYVDGNNLLK